jgi:AraC family transcriptional regulator of adaptative response / DNA-3-methyladenine glycosylase II
MSLHEDAAYLALKTHDARFDGRLFVGVTSTGIYCRPVCRVRTPLRRNCRFFANAASAEREGFRPCLRCRPELAPGLSLADSSQVLAQHAARLIEQAARSGSDPYLPDIAARLGVTDRHLRRIFRQAHGVTPIDYLSTQRLLLAKQLLTDTDLPVTQVALASGHASLRRFNAAFVLRYRMNPSALRKQAMRAPGPAIGARDTAPVLRLAYRPPYDIDGLLAFMARRALPGIEAVDGLELRRTLAWPHQGQWLRGWVQCRFAPARHELQLSLAPALLPAIGGLLQRLRHALDLDADPSLIDPCLAALPAPPPAGLRVPGAMDGFETASRIILGQQVTVAAARTLTSRLVVEFGQTIETPFADLDRLFPGAEDIADAAPQRIGRLGIVRQRVTALQALARAVADGQLELHPGAPLQQTLAALRALPGIGEWTAQLIAMRVLAWPDAFAATDIGVLNALGTRDPAQALARAEAWRPWRAYALMGLWRMLEQES